MSKSLIIYFSRADENYSVGYISKGNTEYIAEFVQELTGADMFKVEPEVPYAADYKTCIEEAKKRIGNILTAFERLHVEYRAFHEELEGLRHSEEDVRKLYDDFTGKALSELFGKLPEKIREKNHSWERLNISIGLMENYCHAYIENKFNENELKYMREETIRIVEKMMWEDCDDF